MGFGGRLYTFRAMLLGFGMFGRGYTNVTIDLWELRENHIGGSSGSHMFLGFRTRCSAGTKFKIVYHENAKQ